MKATVSAIIVSLSFASAATPVAQDPVVRVTPDKLKWQSNPDEGLFGRSLPAQQNKK